MSDRLSDALKDLDVEGATDARAAVDIVGAVLAVGLSSTLLDLTATVSEIAVVGALLVSVLVGIAAGIGPAWQAASVDPTVALRYE